MKKLALVILFIACGCSTFAQINGHIELNPQQLSITRIDGYDHIECEGISDKTMRIGAPELPVIYKQYVIPADAEVSNISIAKHSQTALNGIYVPYPVQPGIPVGDDSDIDFIEPDSAIYHGAEPYPAVRYEIVADGIQYGYHIISVLFYPVSYDPTDGKIYLHNFNFTLSWKGGEAKATQTPAASSRMHELERKLVKSIVDNPEAVDTYYASTAKGSGSKSGQVAQTLNTFSYGTPDYIIITSNELKSTFQRLADWKTKKGVPTVIKCVEDIANEYQGSDLQEKIHTYLRACYEERRSSFFVLLGGDSEIIPPREYKGRKKENGKCYPTDAYYRDLMCDWNTNKNSEFAERRYDYTSVKMEDLVYLSRAPVENVSEAEIFIDKVLHYEKMNLPNITPQYLNNHLAISAFLGTNTQGRFYGDCINTLSKYYRNYTSLNRWYLFDHCICTLPDHNRLDTLSIGEELTRESMLRALNGNSDLGQAHIVYHQDHSNPRQLGASSLDKYQNVSVEDVDALNNSGYPQIFISGGCQPSVFNLDCIAEHFINNPDYGATAFIGNANNGISNECYVLSHFLDILYGSHVERLGILYTEILKKNTYTYTSDETEIAPLPLRIHLFGDPEMPVWSAVPQSLNVSITPDTITSGTGQISLQVHNLPVGQEATVCFMKDGEVYVTTAIADTTTHTFAYTPRTPGTLSVTVTVPNFIPYEADIPVSVANGAAIMLDEVTGCSDGLVAGNTHAIHCRLRNDSAAAVQGVTAVLECQSPYISIAADTLQYGDIPAGQHICSPDSFAVSISPDAPAIERGTWNAPCFRLTIYRGTDIERVDTFSAEILSPVLKISGVSIRNATGNPAWAPAAGSQVTLDMSYSVYGRGQRTPINWQVASQSNRIGGITVADSTCTFAIANGYTAGESLPLTVRLMQGGYCLDSLDVDITAPLYSIDLASVVCEPGASSIKLSWSPVATTHPVAYNVYRGESADGTFTRMNNTPLSYCFYEDTGLPSPHVYYYKVSVVTAGREGPLSDAVRAWTTFPLILQKEGYSDNGNVFIGKNPPVAVDVDLDGQKEIVYSVYGDSQSALIVLNTDGTEPFDLDGNVTTFSGFARMDFRVQMTPAVADIKATGEYSITALKFKSDDQASLCLSVSDANSNSMPDTLWCHDINGMAYQGAVCTQMRASDKAGKKTIYLKPGSSGVSILGADGTEEAAFGNEVSGNYSTVCVADLDNDGTKEIICGGVNAVYVWRPDGTVFMRSPFFSRSACDFRSSPVVCDLDGDGQKEIVLATRNDPSRIYAIKLDGTCVGAFDGTVTLPYPVGTHEGLDHSVSVGDINADGHLEVVTLGTGRVAAWSHTGDSIFNVTSTDVFIRDGWATHTEKPLIADVDGDGMADIVFGGSDKVFAVHGDGTEVVGFPLTATGTVNQNICISDIDGDGRNEIITLSSEDGYVSVWRTAGTTIEWGHPRFSNEACGEYVPGYKDPLVVTTDTEWNGTAYPNDIYVSAGTLTIPASRSLCLSNGHRIVVMEGAQLVVQGTITDADIYVRAGGRIVLDGGKINLNRYGSFTAEIGGKVEVIQGEVNTWR